MLPALSVLLVFDGVCIARNLLSSRTRMHGTLYELKSLPHILLIRRRSRIQIYSNNAHRPQRYTSFQNRKNINVTRLLHFTLQICTTDTCSRVKPGVATYALQQMCICWTRPFAHHTCSRCICPYGFNIYSTSANMVWQRPTSCEVVDKYSFFKLCI